MMLSVAQVNDNWLEDVLQVDALKSAVARVLGQSVPVTEEDEGQTDEYCVVRRFKQIRSVANMSNPLATIAGLSSTLLGTNIAPSDTYVERCQEASTKLIVIKITAEDLLEAATDQLDDLLDRTSKVSQDASAPRNRNFTTCIQWHVRVWRFVRRNHTSLFAMMLAAVVAHWLHQLTLWYNKQSVADTVESQVRPLSLLKADS
jgi:hypothetical protein